MVIKKALAALLCLGVICSGIFYLKENFGDAEAGEVQSETGPDVFVGKIDIKDSPYFKAPDFYNMKSEGSLILLEKFKTHQQRSGYTCGPAACAMVIEYFTKERQDEFAMGKVMGTNNTNGTRIKGMVKYFKQIGWQVESSEDFDTPSTYGDFLVFVDKHLKDNTPVIVENVEWGGHYRVIIGHDTMGTKHEGDDVLIMADPFDTCDHIQDGYVIVNAEKFFYMWFDHMLFPKKEQNKPWIVAKPR